MVFNENKTGNNKAKRRGASIHESAVTILTSGCHFNGRMYCRGSSRIGGKIEGEIISEGLLIVEEEAEIIAKIEAEEAVIQGRVRGQIKASAKVQLSASCQFEGDIQTPSLIICEGAQFNGTTVMKGDEPYDIEAEEKTPLLDKTANKELPELDLN